MNDDSPPPELAEPTHATPGEDAGLTPCDDTAAAEDAVVVEPSPDQQQPALPHPVVGIGASAGGLEAYSELLDHLSPESGMSFVIISHLAPDQRSFLPEILSRRTRMRVEEIAEGTSPQPNTIHVLGPRVSMTLREGRFRLEERNRGERRQMVIDRFLYSLADEQNTAAVGVILSGAQSDGALGLKAVKAQGGITMVQDEGSAQFSTMPRMAIDADHVDFVLPPAGLAAELNRLSRQYRDGSFQRPPEEAQEGPREWAQLLRHLRTVSGVDFSQYKRSTLRRRVARRMAVHRLDTLKEYVQYLAGSRDEIRCLHEDVLIGVTRFFRDSDMYQALERNVFPSIVAGRAGDSPIRIWVPGCSTGEEVYSIAIALLEYLGSSYEFGSSFQIFGTDISEKSIEKARIGWYSEGILADISPPRIRRFFSRVDGGFQVSKRLRDSCVFARQNLASDPPFSRLDMITCRNVLIYLGPALQRGVIPIFHYALKSDGYLVLGGSETIRQFEHLFTLTDKRNKIYRKNAGGSAMELVTHFRMPSADVFQQESGRRTRELALHGWSDIQLQRAVDRLLLSKFTPAGVVVNDSLDIVQSRGQTAHYLELPSGSVSFHLLRMAKKPLAAPLRELLRRAISGETPAQLSGIRISVNGNVQELRIEVLPIQNAPEPTRYYLVLFIPLETSPASTAAAEAPAQQGAEVEQLRDDLGATKLYLQSLLEERDAANQELISANEEIQSSNEELQSINEELETAKEELQSTNEELQTVNEELQNRNAQLTSTHNDLVNLLNNITIPVLMLDADLRIRQYTPAAERMMNVRPGDLGRRVREIRLNLELDDLEPIMLDVLETLTTRELEVRDLAGRWHLLRVRPYRTTDNKIDGVVLVLVDIDEIRRTQQDILSARDFVSAVVNGVNTPIVVLTSGFNIRLANPAFHQLTGQAAVEGLPFCELAEQHWQTHWLRPQLEALLAAGPGAEPIVTEFQTGKEARALRLFARSMMDDDLLILVAIEDVTDQRHAEAVLRKEKERLESRVQSTESALDRTKEDLRQLAGGVLKAQEEERRRVARELHDDLSQKLALLELNVDTLQRMLPRAPRAVRQQVEHLREDTAMLSNELRRIAYQLHPSILDDLGLPFALKAMVDEFSRREKLEIRFDAPDQWPVLPRDAAGALYRIAQEGLRNVAKHAAGARVEMALTADGSAVQLVLRDNGPGFDLFPEQRVAGMGVLSMRERAALVGGTFELRSANGQGVEIRVFIPTREE